MQIQLKVVLLTGLAVICAVSLLAWRVSSVVQEDTAGFVDEANERQLASVRRLARAKLEGARDQLLAFARAKERGGSSPAFGAFDVVGFAVEGDTKTWEPKWIHTRPEMKASRWEAGKDTVFVRSLPFAKVKDGDLHWVWRLDKKEGPLFALMVSVNVESSASHGTHAGGLPDVATTSAVEGPKKGVVVGFFSDNPLASIGDDFVGSTNSIYVVDDLGYVAAHSSKSYNGSRFSEDDIVKQIRSSGRESGAGTYESLESQKIRGRWERVEGTNLYAVIAAPVSVTFATARALMNSLVLMGLLATVGAIGAAWMFGGHLVNGLREAQRFALEWKAGNFQPGFLDVARLDEIGDVNRALANLGGGGAAVPPRGPSTSELSSSGGAATQVIAPTTRPQGESAPPADSEAAYRQMALGLSGAMREPIAAILGNIQLLSSKVGDGEVGDHAEAIEREARRLRGVLESLTRVAADDDVKLSPTSLTEVVELAIAGLDREITTSGAQLDLRIGDVPQINASPVPLRLALEALVRQALEAMRTRSTKRLAIETAATSDGKARLVVRDTGLGLDREQLARYFEPFHQPYEGGRATELHLAMAHATFERHFADVHVDSTPGQGTSVCLEFPPTTRPGVGRPKSADERVDARRSVAPPPTAPPASPSSSAVARPIPTAPPLPVPEMKSPVGEAFASPTPPPLETENESSITILGGKSPVIEDEVFPPAPSRDDVIGMGAVMDLSRTAPPKEGETMEMDMPAIELPPDVEVVVPSSPAKGTPMGQSSIVPESASGGDTAIAWTPFADAATQIIDTSGDKSPENTAEPKDEMALEGNTVLDAPAAERASSGAGVFDIDIPASFLVDELESFKPIALGTALGRGTPARGVANPEDNDEPTTVANPLLSPTAAPKTARPVVAEPPRAPAPSLHASGREPLARDGFQVKIRRPKTKG